MLTCQCWLLYLWDLGETWHRVSRCIPEQLCKVSPKSHCDFLCFWCFLGQGAQMLTRQCWLLYLWDLVQTWYSGSGCIPEQLCKVSPKSYCDFLCFLMFSWAGFSNVNSSVLTIVLVGFGGNLVQGFRVYPWTAVQSFPQIVLCFSLFLMFSWAGCWDVNSSVLTFLLVGFGGNLVQGFRVFTWRAVPSLPQMVLWFSLFLMLS